MKVLSPSLRLKFKSFFLKLWNGLVETMNSDLMDLTNGLSCGSNAEAGRQWSYVL